MEKDIARHIIDGKITSPMTFTLSIVGRENIEKLRAIADSIKAKTDSI
jgi:hypothetical protein